MIHPVTRTKNNIPVYVDLVQSLAAANISQQPNLLALVKEVIETLTVTGELFAIEHDMGRSIGFNPVVATKASDTILYGQLARQNDYMRFVKNGKATSTQYLTIILRRDSESNYELHQTWIGRLHPPLPGGEDETSDSRAFWEEHAYMLELQSSVQPRSITKVCPY